MTTTLKNFFNVLKKYYDIETPSIKTQTVKYHYRGRE